MNQEFAAAVNQICDEKGIKPEQVYETIGAAMASAFRKDCGRPGQKIEAKFDTKTGQARIYQVLEVVRQKDLENPDRQISLKEAKKINKKIKVEDEIKIEKEAPDNYGRIAAQTAKQVIVQKVRELERDVLFQEFKDRVGELLTGTVQQIEGANVIVNLGRANGILFPKEQIENERYYIGQRLKVYVAGVEETTKTPQIVLSRIHPEMIHRLFELEVPEINSGAVEIKAIVREAGKRSKVSVMANQEGVDPVGSCVGQRGTRIQAVLAEIGEEKIDIILWDRDEEKYLTNALSPAKVKLIKLNKKQKIAEVFVADDQLSLAIGKKGQNVRLASKLTGWEIKVDKVKQIQKKPTKKQAKDTQRKIKEEVQEKTAAKIDTEKPAKNKSIAKFAEPQIKTKSKSKTKKIVKK